MTHDVQLHLTVANLPTASLRSPPSHHHEDAATVTAVRVVPVTQAAARPPSAPSLSPQAATPASTHLPCQHHEATVTASLSGSGPQAGTITTAAVTAPNMMALSRRMPEPVEVHSGEAVGEGVGGGVAERLEGDIAEVEEGSGGGDGGVEAMSHGKGEGGVLCEAEDAVDKKEVEKHQDEEGWVHVSCHLNLREEERLQGGREKLAVRVKERASVNTLRSKLCELLSQPHGGVSAWCQILGDNGDSKEGKAEGQSNVGGMESADFRLIG